jgi:hypothetical protein
VAEEALQGRESKERGRLLMWANPETDFYCSQEVALYRLEAREAANVRTFATQKSARVVDSGKDVSDWRNGGR